MMATTSATRLPFAILVKACRLMNEGGLLAPGTAVRAVAHQEKAEFALRSLDADIDSPTGGLITLGTRAIIGPSINPSTAWRMMRIDCRISSTRTT